MPRSVIAPLIVLLMLVVAVPVLADVHETPPWRDTFSWLRDLVQAWLDFEPSGESAHGRVQATAPGATGYIQPNGEPAAGYIQPSVEPGTGYIEPNGEPATGYIQQIGEPDTSGAGSAEPNVVGPQRTP